MGESCWQPVVGAAQRRRQRRLRSWWRHEQQSIAAALATVMHHSSGKVHTANGAPRSQKLATRAEEEVEYEPHYRRLHLRGSGRHLCLRLLGRSGVTAPCGTPREKLLS